VGECKVGQPTLRWTRREVGDAELLDYVGPLSSQGIGVVKISERVAGSKFINEVSIYDPVVGSSQVADINWTGIGARHSIVAASAVGTVARSILVCIASKYLVVAVKDMIAANVKSVDAERARHIGNKVWNIKARSC